MELTHIGLMNVGHLCFLLSHCYNVFKRFYYMLGSNTQGFFVFFDCESQCTEERKRKREQNSKEQNRALKYLHIENRTKDHPMMSSSFPSVSFCYHVIVIADFPSPREITSFEHVLEN